MEQAACILIYTQSRKGCKIMALRDFRTAISKWKRAYLGLHRMQQMTLPRPQFGLLQGIFADNSRVVFQVRLCTAEPLDNVHGKELLSSEIKIQISSLTSTPSHYAFITSNSSSYKVVHAQDLYNLQPVNVCTITSDTAIQDAMTMKYRTLFAQCLPLIILRTIATSKHSCVLLSENLNFKQTVALYNFNCSSNTFKCTAIHEIVFILTYVLPVVKTHKGLTLNSSHSCEC